MRWVELIDGVSEVDERRSSRIGRRGKARHSVRARGERWRKDGLRA